MSYFVYKANIMVVIMQHGDLSAMPGDFPFHRLLTRCSLIVEASLSVVKKKQKYNRRHHL